MGTRSAIGVRYKGQDLLAYNQNDGFYEDVGNAVLQELRSDIAEHGSHAIERWKDLVDRLRVIPADAPDPTELDVRRYEEYADSGVSTGKDWYALLRNLQGTLLKRLESGVWYDDGQFITDSLFCEYAYILNLDEEVFEVYKGFQKAPGPGRYGAIKEEGNEYYGVALVATFKLKELPKAFVQGEDDELKVVQEAASGSTDSNEGLPTEEDLAGVGNT